jgi:hypothetical protein
MVIYVALEQLQRSPEVQHVQLPHNEVVASSYHTEMESCQHVTYE